MQASYCRYLLLILMTFLMVPAQAQKKGYARGYIITHDGETLEGWVKDRTSGDFMKLYTRVRFKADDALVHRKYHPDEILGYGYNNQHFESAPLIEESEFFKFRYPVNENYSRVFLKVIARNRDLTYFHWEYMDSESNYLDYIPLFYRDGSHEMVRVTQGILGLKKKRLMEYFRDCPNLVEAIKSKRLVEVHEVYDFYLEHCIAP